MNEKINQIIEILKTLTLLDIAQLVTEIKKVFNVNINNLIENKNINTNVIPSELENEKTTFSITLIEIPLDKKISVLKVVRNITGLGLKESKDIIDNLPKILKENITKEESDKIKIEFESFGAKVKIL
jgi:large subunit ribosomal protein L7/L12